MEIIGKNYLTMSWAYSQVVVSRFFLPKNTIFLKKIQPLLKLNPTLDFFSMFLKIKMIVIMIYPKTQIEMQKPKEKRKICKPSSGCLPRSASFDGVMSWTPCRPMWYCLEVWSPYAPSVPYAFSCMFGPFLNKLF